MLREVIEMKLTAVRFVLVVLIGLVAMSALAVAQGTPAPLGLVPMPTPQPLNVNIWTDRSVYAIGETANIHFTVSQPSYIYIYNIQSDGIVRLIFPNAYSRGNFVPAGTHVLPDGLYQFTVAPPTGMEQLQIIASPINLRLGPSSFFEPFPFVGVNPHSATHQIRVRIMGIVPEPIFSTAWTSFQIVAAHAHTPPSHPGFTPHMPFHPPFFGQPGATWHWQGGQWHFGLPTSGWYWFFGSDGSWHFRIIFHFGAGR